MTKPIDADKHFVLNTLAAVNDFRRAQDKECPRLALSQREMVLVTIVRDIASRDVGPRNAQKAAGDALQLWLDMYERPIWPTEAT